MGAGGALGLGGLPSHYPLNLDNHSKLTKFKGSLCSMPSIAGFRVFLEKCLLNSKII